MIFKQYLGEIMTQFGFITNNQLEEALVKQRELIANKKKQLQSSPDKLISVTRATAEVHQTPMLGQILYNMGYVTPDQLETALEKQSSAVNLYNSLEKEKLIIALDTISSLIPLLDQALIMSNFMGHVNRLVGAEASILMLLDENSNELVFSISDESNPGVLKDVRSPVGKGIAGWVTENRKYLLVSDVKKEPRFVPEIDQIPGVQSRSILCVPIMTRQTLIGVVHAVNRSNGDTFREEDALLLNIVSSNVAMAVENSRRYENLQEKLKEKTN